MGIIERVRAVGVPLDHVVVIGSGVLDALELRTAGDVDLVISAEAFVNLAKDSSWVLGVKHDEVMLSRGDCEVFLSWGSSGRPNFDQLYQDALVIDGVHFVNPQFLLEWKRQRGSEKDITDITLLQGYLAS